MNRYGQWSWLAVSLVGHAWLAYATPRTDTAQLLLLWCGLFLLYGLLWIKQVEKDFLLFVGAAVLFRLLWLFAMPALSDDVYRFIWDGRLLSHGYNPFLHLPSDIIDKGWAQEIGLGQELFQKLNSPDYYTVYPPLLQGWFAVATVVGGSTYSAAIWLKVPLLLAEVGSLWLVYQLVKDSAGGELKARRSVLLYGLNPLVIAELTGNIHYEGLTIFFLLACFYFWKNQRLHLSALMLALAVGVKLLPLIFLPLLISRLRLREQIRYVVIVGIGVLLPFLPFLDWTIWYNMSDSLGLYFQRFEFNAGLYYLLRAVGTWLVGYNPIGTLGPVLSLISFTTILFLSFYRKLPFSLYERALLILTVYLLCATTVHPWYVVPLVALGALTRFRYPVVWSALLPFTYLAYGQVPFAESLWVVAVEYLVVGGWLVAEVSTLSE
ncbi:glycosyltransferase 87 family protein [Telluribacter sp. SYSU D00476]|uniref:glycosyltransferase 87 family protein n=1 Tax=Telluribacter sp. SYSU D00476 TaxID=2811430 RepID=UPI001FF0E3A2|nr:glycosyltransferase 87 family protein [Telluribacter sp. SYSU D00476]